MDSSLPRPTRSDTSPKKLSTQQPSMSMLAMVTPSSHAPFNSSKHAWDAPPPADYSQPRTENKSIALPSIRQAFPELHLSITPQDRQPPRTAFSQSPSRPAPRPLTSPDYVHSPESHKRRRISHEDEQENLRARQVPRLYRSPERSQPSQTSPTRPPPPPSANDTWTRPASFAPSPNLPPPMQIKDRADHRAALPSLPPPAVAFDRDSRPIHRVQDRAAEEAGSRPSGAAPRPPPPMSDAHAPYQDASYAYPYHQPPRYQATSTSAMSPYDRTPFTGGATYGSHYQEMRRYGDMAIGGDSKQRKRRGNLPKETTDQLRAWFVSHLQHPYPTEDEKQELMRKTGLQMNQISNWFINARRRQLPAMISNARAESDVMQSQSRDGNIMATTERTDYGLTKRDTLPLSDGEGGSYDDEVDQRANSLKRGSV